MPVYRNKNGNGWYVMVRYTDWQGNRKQKCQRGFATRREAQDFEAKFSLQKRADINMTLESFCELYEADIRPRIKETTWITKENIIRTKILPYLGKRRLCEITAKDIVDWQNEIMTLDGARGTPISLTYQKTIHAQLSAIFNHAIRYYELSLNPAQRAGGMGGGGEQGDALLDEGGVPEIRGGDDGQTDLLLCFRGAVLVRYPGGRAAGPDTRGFRL